MPYPYYRVNWLGSGKSPLETEALLETGKNMYRVFGGHPLIDIYSLISHYCNWDGVTLIEITEVEPYPNPPIDWKTKEHQGLFCRHFDYVRDVEPGSPELAAGTVLDLVEKNDNDSPTCRGALFFISLDEIGHPEKKRLFDIARNHKDWITSGQALRLIGKIERTKTDVAQLIDIIESHKHAGVRLQACYAIPRDKIGSPEKKRLFDIAENIINTTSEENINSIHSHWHVCGWIFASVSPGVDYLLKIAEGDGKLAARRAAIDAIPVSSVKGEVKNRLLKISKPFDWSLQLVQSAALRLLDKAL